MHYFLSLKQTYAMQREPYESKWRQANAAVYMIDDQLDKVYNGRAEVNSPIMKWKVKGIASRIARIIFNVPPIGRLESKVQEFQNTPKKNLIDLWNKYIFENQLDAINFKEAYKLFTKMKCIEGTAVAKITQEFETKEVDFFQDGEDPEEVVVKDNTYFRPLLLTEFYSDVSKYDINQSQACIHSTVISVEELRRDAKRTELEEVELVDPNTGQVVGTEERKIKTGKYFNLELLEGDGKNLTDQQEEYLSLLGANITQTQTFQKKIKEMKKTGFVQIDECYGKCFIDGKEQEVICTIANGNVVIRMEVSPFKHRRYVRPFVVGRYELVPNCLYGDSNVIAGKNLLEELNASRAQAIDAKTRSISNMWYEDTSKQVVWDRIWRPNGVVKGIGPNGLQPLLNPYLGSITNESSNLIQRDMDQLWSLSPVQEGTTDSRLIPKTKGGTLAVIQQNDMPLNDIIDNAIEDELKPFIEMLYERDLTFKSVEDLLTVWTPEQIEKAGITPDTSMRELFFDMNVRILGNLELSNEVAHQNGYMNFINIAQTIPPIAKRLDWTYISEKLLKAFGIKDDAEGIFIDEEIIQQAEQQQAQQAQQAQEQAQIQAEQVDTIQRAKEQEDYRRKVETDTESKLVEMQSEALIERTTGQKVQ
jgi:hypothetical protein